MPFHLNLPKPPLDAKLSGMLLLVVTLVAMMALSLSGNNARVNGSIAGISGRTIITDKEFTELPLKIATGETITYSLEDNFFAFSFRWMGEGLKFKDADQALFTTVTASADLASDDGLHYSDMYYDLNGSLTIKNDGARDITLFLINPISDTNPNIANLEPEPTSGKQLNLQSGPNISNINIINRQQWGADESKSFWSPKYKDSRRFIVHHTAWPNDADYQDTVRAIYLYHTEGRRWGDIGYNYLIDPAGNIYEGRRGGAAAIGAHTGGQNDGSIGIAMMGNFTTQLPPQTAQDSLRELLVDRAIFHDLNLNWGSTVIGHKDSGNITQCPGDALYALLPNLVATAALEKQNSPETDLSVAVAEAKAALVGHTDVRLRIIFTPEALAESSPSELTAAYGGARRTKYTDNSVLMTIESIPGYGGDWSDDTFKRMQDLYAIYSLDPNVESVELVSDPIGAYANVPRANRSVALEFFDYSNAYTKYNGFIKTGSGTITIYDETLNEIFVELDVTDTEQVAISYQRFLNLYPEGKYREGHTYRVTICDGCVVEQVSEAPLPQRGWGFTIEQSTFSPVFRFWSNDLASHFYTANESEKTKLQISPKLSKVWNYEKEAFYALSKYDCYKGDPVHRFWSDRFNGHFYTINYNEYAKVRLDKRLSQYWDYEGFNFCAYDYPREGTVPVYRFWSDKFNGHFYTINDSERDKIINNYPNDVWKYEKIAFWAMPDTIMD